MYKYEEIIPDNQRVGRRKQRKTSECRSKSKLTGKFTIDQQAKTGKQKSLPRKAKDFSNDLGTIPSINVSLKPLDKEKTPVDFFYWENGMDSITFLKIMEKLLPASFFQSGKIEDVISDVFEEFNRKFKKCELDFIDGSSITFVSEPLFSFSYVYTFDLLDFHIRYPFYIRKVLYSFMRSISESIGIPFLEVDYDYYMGWILDEDEDTITMYTEIIEEAQNLETKIKSESLVIELDLIRDRDWIVDFLTLNDLPEIAERVKQIIDLINNVNPSFANISLQEIHPNGFIAFSTFEESCFNDFVCQPMIEMANESGLCVESKFTINLKDRIEDITLPLDAVYLDKILVLLSEIIIYENKESEQADT